MRIVAVKERLATKKFLHTAHGLDVVPGDERHRHRDGPGIGETVFGELPSRLLPDPRPDGSRSSWPRCSAISAFGTGAAKREPGRLKNCPGPGC